MAREYEQKTENVTRSHLVRLTCDLCGREDQGGNWGAGNFAVNETEIQVTVRQRQGVEYVDYGSGEKYEVDLCPQCFKDRLIPWLREQGAKVEPMDWEY